MVNHKIITTVHKVASVSPIMIIESQILYPTVPFRPNSSLFLFIFPFLLLLFFLYKEIFVSPPPALLYTSRNTFRDLLPTTHSREITGGSDLSAISDSPAARTERRSWKIGGARDASNARFPRFPSLFSVRCPLQSRTYPGNKIGFRDRGGIAGSRRDNLESPRNERRYRFFSFPFFFPLPFLSAPNFSRKLRKLWKLCTGIGAIRRRVYVLANTFVKFSPEISLVLRHATSSFRSWKKSIYSPPLCSCSLFRFARAPRETAKRF